MGSISAVADGALLAVVGRSVSVVMVVLRAAVVGRGIVAAQISENVALVRLRSCSGVAERGGWVGRVLAGESGEGGRQLFR